MQVSAVAPKLALAGMPRTRIGARSPRVVYSTAVRAGQPRGVPPPTISDYVSTIRTSSTSRRLCAPRRVSPRIFLE